MLSLPDFKEKSIIMCFPEDGHKIHFKNDNICIKDDADKIILQSSCYRAFSLWVIGRTTLTSVILEKSKRFGFSVYLLSNNFKPIGLWSCATEGNFLLRKKQYDFQSISISKHIIENKISNQISLLKEIRTKNEECKKAISSLEEYCSQVKDVCDSQTLLGIEGVSAKMYFQIFFEKLNWQGRKPRIKTDFLNTTLDIGYTFLFNYLECMLNLYGFDIYQGVYHKNFFQRKSLVCDLMEPFRCIIDKKIITSFGLKQIKEEDFIIKNNQYFLKKEKGKEYSRLIFEGILEYKNEIFLYMQEYYRCFIRNRDITNYPLFKMKC